MIWWKDYWLNISYTIFIPINRKAFLRKYLTYAACKVRGGHSTYLSIFWKDSAWNEKSHNEWRIYRVLHCDIDLLMISLYSSFCLGSYCIIKETGNWWVNPFFLRWELQTVCLFAYLYSRNQILCFLKFNFLLLYNF